MDEIRAAAAAAAPNSSRWAPNREQRPMESRTYTEEEERRS